MCVHSPAKQCRGQAGAVLVYRKDPNKNNHRACVFVFTRKGHRIVSICEVKNGLFALNKRALIVGSFQPEFIELTVNFPLLQERNVSNIGCSFNCCRREFPDWSAADGVVTGCIQALSCHCHCHCCGTSKKTNSESSSLL